MADIVDRLETVTRDFPSTLIIGAGETTELLTPACGVRHIVHADLAPGRLPKTGARAVADDEAPPFAPQSFDLVLSVLTLHATNDFIGALIQTRELLKPDGLFIAAVFGEGTLSVWRAALRKAEVADTGGLAARIAPFAAVQDFGQALARAGFAMPVTDTDEVDVVYEDPARMLADLKGMGETGVLAGSTAPLRRSTLFSALERFAEAGGREKFNIVYLTGWAPGPDQPKPRPRGSATASLAAAVKNFEKE